MAFEIPLGDRRRPARAGRGMGGGAGAPAAPPPAVTMSPERRRAARGRLWRESAEAYLYLLPALAILGTFSFWPVVKSLELSFFKWDMISPVKTFVGLKNYESLLFKDEEFWKAIGNTAYYVVGTVPATIVLALGVALLLNMKIRLRAFFRVAFFIPWVTSTVAISMVWKWIFHADYGLLNYFLGWFHVPAQRWLIEPQLAMPAVIIMSIWRHIGYNVIIFLAGLQSIDKEYYEAARVDGATPWQTFRYITWPLLSPTTFFISVISVIGAFKVFQEIFVLFTGGSGPLRSAYTIVFFVYDKAFRDWEMGYASAGAWLLFAIIFALTLAQFRLSRNRVYYS